ncbi:hypothetical protein [Sorangium sp. So ce385]|uniref:hypothetical protein n=1 Tax=Sorangium sp. So ce385 TaxID=3133308 RepID=UPI003F5B9644
MGHRKRTKKLLLVVAAAGLTACEDDSHINPPPPPLVCDEVADGSALWARGTLTRDPQQPGALWIELNHEGAWVDPPIVTALSGMTITSIGTSFDSRNIHAVMDDGATTASFQVRGKLTDPETTCDVDRTFTLTIDESGRVEVTRRDALPFLPYRHASLDVMQCNGGEDEQCAPGGGEHVAGTNAAGNIEAAAGGARGDVGRRGRASTRPRG